VATVVLSTVVLREPKRVDERATASGSSERLSLIGKMVHALSGPGSPYYVLAFVIMFGNSSLFTALALFLTDRYGVGVEIVGIAFALNGGFGALVQGVAIGSITTKLGEYSTIILGLVVGIAGFALLVSAPIIHIAMFATILTSVSMALTRPSAASLLSQVTPLPQGITMGIQGSMDSLGRVIGPLWAGFAYDQMSTLPFVSSTLAFVAMAMYLQARKRDYVGVLRARQSAME